MSSGNVLTHARNAVRALSSLAPLWGLVAQPAARADGITALVRVKGEEEWIEPCLLSIRDFADEILVLDNGASKATREKIEELRTRLGDRIRLETYPDADLFEVSNLGLALARFRWVIRWDADFVAHTSGAADVAHLRRYLLDLDRRRYYLVSVAAAEVAGDLSHQFPDIAVRHDGQAVVWSPRLRYVAVRRTVPFERLALPERALRARRPVRQTLESLRTPRYYRLLRWRTPAYMHVNVKSQEHMLLRHFWLDWLDATEGGATCSHEAYVAQRVGDEWALSSLADAASRFVTAYCQQLVPYDAARSGPYPEMLLPYLRAPRYRVEARGGAIVGRREEA
jgi:glycosyltransferase involved in cell wall biosynthesis